MTYDDNIRDKDRIETSDLNGVFRKCNKWMTNLVVSSDSVRVIHRDIPILCDWHRDRLCTRERERSLHRSIELASSAMFYHCLRIIVITG